MADLDLIEANEAFAAQALAVNKAMGWDVDKVNVNGGAIALGHPVGMSGARLVLTLALELRRRGGGTGAAALCPCPVPLEYSIEWLTCAFASRSDVSCAENLIRPGGSCRWREWRCSGSGGTGVGFFPEVLPAAA